MKVGDLVMYKWHPDGHHPKPEHAGIVISTDGLMLCSHALVINEKPYIMGTVEVMWNTDKIEKETFDDLEIINESR